MLVLCHHLSVKMPYEEKKTFYLYGRGFHPDSLGLGHLVLGDFKNPTKVPHCPGPKLSDDELSKWTTASSHSGTFVEAAGWTFKPEVEVLEIGKVGAGWTCERSKMLQAQNGKRVELHPNKVRSFFQDKVLAGEGVKESLKKWMTISRCKYVFWKLGLRNLPLICPQIWCLTGLFELSGVTATTATRHSPTASVGISSAIVTACTGVPVGGSVELGRDFSAKWDGFDPDTLIWAAQYQLVNLKPVMRTTGEEASPVNYVELYPDYTFAPGQVLADDGDRDDAFALELEDEFAPDANEQKWGETYWQDFEKAKKETENYI